VQLIDNNNEIIKFNSLSCQVPDNAQHQDGESWMSAREWQPKGIDINHPEDTLITDKQSSYNASPTEEHSFLSHRTFKTSSETTWQANENQQQCSENSNGVHTAS
jgi:hypothetical protein